MQSVSIAIARAALVTALVLSIGATPVSKTAARQMEQGPPLAATYSFHSLDPFASGDQLVHLDLTLSPDGTAHVEEASVAEGGSAFTADGTWDAQGDEVRLVLDYENGQPLDAPNRYTIVFADGFPAELAYQHGDAQAPFGPLAFTLGSGDEHPLVPHLNQLLARIGHVDFRDPGLTSQRYGEYTRRAVALFQSAHGLTPTGLVDLRTWRALLAASQQADHGQASYSVARAPAAQTSGQPFYVTFDDGPHPSWTPRVLDALARHGARATFFMLGQEAQRYPDLVRQVAQAGHYVADHTWDHKSLEGVSQQVFVQEVQNTRDVLVKEASDLFKLDGGVNYVRPPYGATDSSTRTYAADLGMRLVMWDVDPMDWRQPGAQQISSHVLEHAQPGGIVLMHDGGGDRSQTVTALETILPGLAAKGYRFPTIFESDTRAPAAPAAPSATPAPVNPNAWHVAGTGGAGANLRAQPSTSASVLAKLAEGMEIQPLEGPVDGDGVQWRKVRAGGQDGWIAADLVRGPTQGSTAVRPPAVSASVAAEWVVGGTDGAGANVRAQPSTAAGVVTVLTDETPVESLEGPTSAGGLAWRKVRAQGAEGWIDAAYVRHR